MSALIRQREGVQPPLLLLPPLGADARFYSPLLAELEVEAWTADVHPDPAAPTLSQVADRLASAIRATVDRPVAVLGVSLGGLVAQHLAAAHPGLVSKLVLADTVVSYPSAMRDMWASRAEVVSADGTEAIVEATLDTWYGPSRSARLEEICRAQVLATEAATYARACRALRDADTSAVLDAIEAPTLVLCGDQDAPVFVSASTQLAERLSPGAGVTWLAGAHHASLLEQPQAAARAITQHLRRSAS